MKINLPQIYISYRKTLTTLMVIFLSIIFFGMQASVSFAGQPYYSPYDTENCVSPEIEFTIGEFDVLGCAEVGVGGTLHENPKVYDLDDIVARLKSFAEKFIKQGFVGEIAKDAGCTNAVYFIIAPKSEEPLQEYTHYNTGPWGECLAVGQTNTVPPTTIYAETRTVTSYVDTIPPNDSAPDASRPCSLGTLYNHYNTGPWGECTGYDPDTGLGGTQTRTNTGYVNTIPPNDPIPAGSRSCSATLYTHWDTGAWGVCANYDPDTGQGGTQSRPVTERTDASCCDDTKPTPTRQCTLLADYDLYDVSGDLNNITNIFSIFISFLGGEQIALSSIAQIGIAPVFINHPDQPDVTFSVVGVEPALPVGTEYFFEPQTLNSEQYSSGTKFSVQVPLTPAGLYKITIQASGGGIVKQAVVNLNVSITNPEFIEL